MAKVATLSEVAHIAAMALPLKINGMSADT